MLRFALLCSIFSFFGHSQSALERIISSPLYVGEICRSDEIIDPDNLEEVKDCIKQVFHGVESFFEEIIDCNYTNFSQRRHKVFDFFYIPKDLSIGYSERVFPRLIGRSFRESIKHISTVIAHEYGHHLFDQKIYSGKATIEIKGLHEFFGDVAAYILSGDERAITLYLNFMYGKNEVFKLRNFGLKMNDSDWRDHFKISLFNYSGTEDKFYVDEHYLFTHAYNKILKKIKEKGLEGNEIEIIEEIAHIFKKFIKLKLRKFNNNILKKSYESSLYNTSYSVAQGRYYLTTQVFSPEVLEEGSLPNLRGTLVEMNRQRRLSYIKNGQGYRGYATVKSMIIEYTVFLSKELENYFDYANFLQ